MKTPTVKVGEFSLFLKMISNFKFLNKIFNQVFGVVWGLLHTLKSSYVIYVSLNGFFLTFSAWSSTWHATWRNVVYLAVLQCRIERLFCLSLGPCQCEIRPNPILMHLSQCD